MKTALDYAKGYSVFRVFSFGQFAPPAIRFATSLVIVGLVAGCVVWRADDPRLVRGMPSAECLQTNDPAEVQQQVEARRENATAVLRQQIGEPFPDLTLINYRGEVVRLASLRGRRVAVLAAIGPFVTTRRWMEELSSRHWEVSPSFDELVVLVSYGGDRSWKKLIKSCPKVYLVGWPLEGFLAAVNSYPIMYAVGADGTFEGHWSYGQQPLADI